MGKVDLPFSTWKHNNWVNSFTIKQIKRIKPRITYDIGIGDGFYAKLLKWLGSKSKIIGVEIYIEWVNFCRNLNIYDEIHHMDACSFLSGDVGGDLIIFGDVLEHMVKIDMISTLQNGVKKFKWVILNGPIGYQAQECTTELGGAHICGITKEEDLIRYDIVKYNEIPNIMMNCLIRGKLC